MKHLAWIFPILLAACVNEELDPNRNVEDSTVRVETPTATQFPGEVIRLIAGGDGHTCALSVQGNLSCWGRNDSGQLGINSTATQAQPVMVQGIMGPVSFVAAGLKHTCAVAQGSVSCWGANDSGQLGDGTTERRLIPTVVGGLPMDIVSVTAGDGHTCAVSAMGSAFCWGANTVGQLGNPMAAKSLTAVTVTGLTGARKLAAGGAHTCAIDQMNELFCWGLNEFGQFGSSDDFVTVPQTISQDIADVATGRNHTCVIGVNGSVRCTGDNNQGQVDGIPPDLGGIGQSFGLTDVIGLPDEPATKIIAGQSHSCVVQKRKVRCWGDNQKGQLGSDDLLVAKGQSTVALMDWDISGSLQITAGYRHNCGVGGDGLSCWGEGVFGQLGEGAFTEVTNPGLRDLTLGVNRNRPFNVLGLASGIQAVSAGGVHTCAILGGGTPLCWGQNSNGQLGDGSMIDRAVPAPVSMLGNGVRDIAAATYLRSFDETVDPGHTCAIDKSGQAFCWGDNRESQVGDGTVIDRDVPTPVVGLSSPATAIATGFDTSCAALTDGTMACWGLLGTTATAIPGLSGVIDVGVGDFHQCALLDTGEVFCQGNGCCLGDGTGNHTSDPVPVLGIDDATALSVGELVSCAITGEARTLECWGFVELGPMFDGSSPVIVPGLEEGVHDVELGKGFLCAIKQGDVYCWGGNGSGQLGDGTMDRSTVPTKVPGLPSDMIHVTAGDRHTCAVSLSEGLMCWGENSDGQLGNGDTMSIASPAPTPLPVNTPPQVTYAIDPSFASVTSGPQTYVDFATYIHEQNAERDQLVHVGILVADPDDVLVAGSVSLDPFGVLRYELKNQAGAAIVTVTPRDEGGSRAGGSDRGDPHEFRIFNGFGADLRMEFDNYFGGINRNQYGDLAWQLPRATELYGSAADFRYDIENEGPMDLTGARYTADFDYIPVSVGLNFKSAQAKGDPIDDLNWTCTTPSGPCSPASGSGAIDVTYDLAVGESATIQITGPLDTEMGFLEIDAAASPPPGIPSFLDQDNQRTIVMSSGGAGVFLDGFE